MGLPAMARITKVPEETLVELAKSNPVFAPGPENYLRMGGIHGIWRDDFAGALRDALAGADPVDRRKELGLARGGRKFAQPVAEEIRRGEHADPA
jgi:malonate decarboxylase gamma subunit